MMDTSSKYVMTEDVTVDTNVDDPPVDRESNIELSENQSLLHGVITPVVVPADIESENEILDTNSYFSDLNSSTCSYDSRRSKQRSRRKHHGLKRIHYPPQYTAIFLDPNNPLPNGTHLIRPQANSGIDIYQQQHHQFSTFPVAQRFVFCYFLFLE